MIILGIDPGIAKTGYGIIKCSDNENMFLIDFGVIATSTENPHGTRLRKIFKEITRIINHYRPDAVAIETIFYSKSYKALVEVSEVIGVITLAAGHFELEVMKFTPLEVKSAVAGFGRAAKNQVRVMTMNMLNLEEPPRPDHASDALAVAICFRNIYR